MPATGTNLTFMESFTLAGICFSKLLNLEQPFQKHSAKNQLIPSPKLPSTVYHNGQGDWEYSMLESILCNNCNPILSNKATGWMVHGLNTSERKRIFLSPKHPDWTAHPVSYSMGTGVLS
jgi:hypothetical protein